MRNTHSHCVRWRAGINTWVSLWSLMCEWVKGKLTRKNPPWSHPGPCSGLWIHPLYELLTTCLCFPYQTWNKHALKLRFPANALLTLLYIFLSFFFFFFPQARSCLLMKFLQLLHRLGYLQWAIVLFCWHVSAGVSHCIAHCFLTSPQKHSSTDILL